MQDDFSQEYDKPAAPHRAFYQQVWFWIALVIIVGTLSLLFPLFQVVVSGVASFAQVAAILVLPVYFIFWKAQMRLPELMLIVTAMGAGTGMLFKVINETQGISSDVTAIAYVIAAMICAIWGFTGAALGLWMVARHKADEQWARLKLVAIGLGLPLSLFGIIIAGCYVAVSLNNEDSKGVVLSICCGIVPCIAMLIYGIVTVIVTLKTRPAHPAVAAGTLGTRIPKPAPVAATPVAAGAMQNDVVPQPCGSVAGPAAAKPVLASGRAVEAGDATGGVIPYKNVPALIAYYCAVFSVIPCFAIGIAAVILGVAGLKKVKAQPAVRGTVHAWIGILAGGFFSLLWLVATIVAIVVACGRA